MAFTFTVLSTLSVALGDLAGIALLCGLRTFSLHCVLLCPQRRLFFLVLAAWFGLLASVVLLLTLFSLLAFLGTRHSFRCLLCLHWLPGLLCKLSCCLTSFRCFFSHPLVARILVCFLIRLLCLLTYFCPKTLNPEP